MIETLRGIVLDYALFSESSVVVRIFTQHHGRRSYIIHGIRKPKSRMGMHLIQPLTLVEFVSHNKENRQVQVITEIKAFIHFNSIPTNIYKTAVSFFIAEILAKCNAEAEGNTELYNFLESTILHLEQKEKLNPLFHHWLLLHLTLYLGFFPWLHNEPGFDFFDLREGVLLRSAPQHVEFTQGEVNRLLVSLAHCNADGLEQISARPELRKQLLEVLLLFYRLHALNGATINSHKVLQEVMQ